MTSNSRFSVSGTEAVDQTESAALVNQLADELLQALRSGTDYPDLPHELSFAFLKGVDTKALSDQERSSLKLEQAADQRLLAMVDQLVNAIQSRKAKLLLKGESMFSLFPKPGIKSFVEERSRESGKSFGGAARELRAAKVLASVPSAQKALDEGTISTGHVEVLARALETGKRNGSKDLTLDEQAYVTGLAQGRTETDYGILVAQFLDGRNPLAADSELDEAKRRRFFNISYTPHGAHFKGFIDKVAAQTLRQALEAASDRPSADDDRSLTQRSADALVDLASAALDAGKLKSGANVRPHVSLVMTENTFAQASKELVRRKKLANIQRELHKNPHGHFASNLSNGANVGNNLTDETINGEANATVAIADAAVTSEANFAIALANAAATGTAVTDVSTANGTHAEVDATPGATSVSEHSFGTTQTPNPTVTPVLDPALLTPIPVDPAEYLDGSPVPLSELERLLCDCEITRVVLDADGLPTNLGRTTRLYTKEHRHAMIARDRRCRFRGCTTRSSRCEIHHIDWWERDEGETSLENGVLVCKRHHTEIHEGKLEVVKNAFGLPDIVAFERDRSDLDRSTSTTRELNLSNSGTHEPIRGSSVAHQSDRNSAAQHLGEQDFSVARARINKLPQSSTARSRHGRISARSRQNEKAVSSRKSSQEQFDLFGS